MTRHVRLAIACIAFALATPHARGAEVDRAPAPASSAETGVPYRPRALRPPSHARPRVGNSPDGAAEAAPLANAVPDIKTVAAGLSLVLGLFLTAAWLLKRSLPKSVGQLPGDVVQVLGRAQLAGKQFAHLVRCGNKLLLVNVTPNGAETLSEITDPLEVDRLLGICAQQNSTSATAAFRDVFQQLGKERARV